MMRSTLTFAAACCGVLGLTAEAVAQVDFRCGGSGARGLSQQRLLTYRLTMTTGEEQERLSVAPSDLAFSARRPVTLEGPVTLGYRIHADPGPRQPECGAHAFPQP